MIKTKHMERRTAAGFKGPLDDSPVARRHRELPEAVAQVARGVRRRGRARRGRAAAARLRDRVLRDAFCRRRLGRRGAERRCARRSRASAPRTPSRSGRVVGEIMKANKGSSSPRPSSASSTKSCSRRPERGAGGPSAEAASVKRPGAAACIRPDRPASGLSTGDGRARDGVREGQAVRVQRVARQAVEAPRAALGRDALVARVA